MKSKRIIVLYLIAALCLMVIGVLLAVYIWYTLQQLNGNSFASTELGVSEEVKDMTVPEEPATAEVQPNDSEAVIIKKASLPEGQQKVLDTIGFEGETIVITEAMVLCAKAALGEERYAEVIAGATPGAFEGFALLQCVNE